MKSLKTSLVFILFLVGLLTILGSGGGGGGSDSSNDYNPPPINDNPPPSNTLPQVTDVSLYSCDYDMFIPYAYSGENIAFVFECTNPEYNISKIYWTLNWPGGSYTYSADSDGNTNKYNPVTYTTVCKTVNTIGEWKVTSWLKTTSGAESNKMFEMFDVVKPPTGSSIQFIPDSEAIEDCESCEMEGQNEWH